MSGSGRSSLNLIGNAVKFTQLGGWVTLSCYADRECVARTMNGDLSVSSEPGGGTTFLLRLPRAG
ncbi:hypothetical protein BH23GEM8_BH23GEM8_01150 [soil metagenome]